MRYDSYELRVVGRVHSELRDRGAAPRQGDEGAPEGWVVLDPSLAPAIDGLEVGQRVIVLTWLHRADREVLRVHPRGDRDRRPQGVFSTRSSDRPNPIGLHEVEILDIEDTRIRVTPLEAIHGTPVVDIKPTLEPIPRR